MPIVCYRIVFIVLGLFIFETTSQSDDEMCIPFRRSQLPATSSPQQVSQGRPGRIGPQGPPGRQGNRGEPGRCGCDPNEIQQLNDRIDSLQEKLQDTIKSISFIENPVIPPNHTFATCTVGLKNRRVRDEDITASSIHRRPYRASNGRLDTPGMSYPYNCACWASKTSVAGEWIQVDLRKPSLVTGVITQGRGDVDQWVKTYKVSYGNSSMKIIQGSNGRDLVYTGNSDRNSYVINRFPVPLTARYFRIIAQTWHNFISLRFELITC